jgi:hypothetical protein
MMAVKDNYKETEDIPDVPMSRRQERLQRRAERRANRYAGGLGWLAGLILIGIGAIYLLNELGILPELTNWWALFLLLPAVAALSAGVGAYRHNGGRWTPAVVFPLLGSLLLASLAAAFLFGFDYGWLWPLFLIAGGLLLLAGTFFPRAK